MEPVTDLRRVAGQVIQCQGRNGRCRQLGGTRRFLSPCPDCGYFPKREQDRVAFEEDLAWLLDTGETHIENISRRLAMSPATLERRLVRTDRKDLLQRIVGRTDAIMGKGAYRKCAA